MVQTSQTSKFTANKNKLNIIYQMYLRKNPHLYISLLIYFANTKLNELQFRQVVKLLMIDFKLFIVIIYNLFLIQLKKTFMKYKK